MANVRNRLVIRLDLWRYTAGYKWYTSGILSVYLTYTDSILAVYCQYTIGKHSRISVNTLFCDVYGPVINHLVTHLTIVTYRIKNSHTE